MKKIYAALYICHIDLIKVCIVLLLAGIIIVIIITIMTVFVVLSSWQRALRELAISSDECSTVPGGLRSSGQ